MTERDSDDNIYINLKRMKSELYTAAICICTQEGTNRAKQLEYWKETRYNIIVYHFMYFWLSSIKLQIGYDIFTDRKYLHRYHNLGHNSWIQPINTYY
jgi:hypothetical protein